MLREISSRLFEEWMIYEELEPFGDARADARAASIVQAILNEPLLPADRRWQSLEECTLRDPADIEQAKRDAARNKREWRAALREMSRGRRVTKRPRLRH